MHDNPKIVAREDRELNFIVISRMADCRSQRAGCIHDLPRQNSWERKGKHDSAATSIAKALRW
jgi:hypothetical protein